MIPGKESPKKTNLRRKNKNYSTPVLKTRGCCCLASSWGMVLTAGICWAYILGQVCAIVTDITEEPNLHFFCSVRFCIDIWCIRLQDSLYTLYIWFPKYLTPGLETMVSYVDFRISGTIYQTGARTIGYCTMVLPLNICHETDPLTIWMNLGNLNLFVIALLSWWYGEESIAWRKKMFQLNTLTQEHRSMV